jgi:hypothetical protein
VSFVWKADKRLKSPEQCAKELLDVALAMGLDDFAAVLAVMCVAQESDFWCPFNRKDVSSENYDHDSESDDGRSVGYLQQQNGRAGETVTGSDNWWGPMSQRMDLKKSGAEFLKRLDDDYQAARNGPVMAGHLIQNVQRSAFPDAYTKHWDRAWKLVNAAKTGGAPAVTNRPDFNEIDQIGWDSANPHGSERSRPPINWFLHTQEGDGNAETLADFLRNSQGNGAVSYHYTIHEDPDDHGVTVCDVIDTDLYSWAVLDANVFSINACFAGSRAGWDRATWLSGYRNAIRVAAYLAVEDVKKYPTLSANVILPPYQSGAGISDHRYVTQCLKIGSHTDVGGPLRPPWNGFPWDVFVADVHSFVGVPADPPPVAVTPPTDRQILEAIYADTQELRAQMGPGHPSWKPIEDSQGNRLTLRDGVRTLVERTKD